MDQTNKISEYKFLILGVLAFLTLGIDLFVMPIEKIIYGEKFSYEAFFEGPWTMVLAHLSIVIVLWLIGIVFLFRWLKKKDVIEELISINKGLEILPLVILAIVASILIAALESIMFTERIPQFYREYQIFYKYYGSKALIISIFQNIYYFVEAVLIVLLLSFIQRAGEILFKKHNIPYGGIGLLMTWGVVHFIGGLVNGLVISGFCIILGWLFIKAKKSWWPSLLFVWLLFFI